MLVGRCRGVMQSSLWRRSYSLERELYWKCSTLSFNSRNFLSPFFIHLTNSKSPFLMAAAWQLQDCTFDLLVPPQSISSLVLLFSTNAILTAGVLEAQHVCIKHSETPDYITGNINDECSSSFFIIFSIIPSRLNNLDRYMSLCVFSAETAVAQEMVQVLSVFHFPSAKFTCSNIIISLQLPKKPDQTSTATSSVFAVTIKV